TELKRTLYREAVTTSNYMPPSLSNACVVQVGGYANNAFYNALSTEKLPREYLSLDSTHDERQNLSKRLEAYDTLIISFPEMSRKAADQYGIKPPTLEFLQYLSQIDTKCLFI